MYFSPCLDDADGGRTAWLSIVAAGSNNGEQAATQLDGQGVKQLLLMDGVGLIEVQQDNSLDWSGCRFQSRLLCPSALSLPLLPCILSPNVFWQHPAVAS